MWCGTSKISWPTFVYFGLHYTLQRICTASSNSGWRGCNKHGALQQAALCTRLLNKVEHTDNQDGQKATRRTLTPTFFLCQISQSRPSWILLCACIFLGDFVHRFWQKFSRGLVRVQSGEHSNCSPVLSSSSRPCANAPWHFLDCTTEPVSAPG